MAGKNLVVYHDTDDGRVRVGTWNYRGASLAPKEVSKVYFAQFPRATGQYYVAPRVWLFGKWRDGELILMERADSDLGGEST
jgi:hypothetical protein